MTGAQHFKEGALDPLAHVDTDFPGSKITKLQRCSQSTTSVREDLHILEVTQQTVLLLTTDSPGKDRPRDRSKELHFGRWDEMFGGFDITLALERDG